MMLALCILFYLFFSFYDGYVWGADTNTYVTMSISREPLYPIYLACFRKIFGDGETYLLWAVVGQGILLGTSIWTVVTYLVKKIQLPKLLYFVMIMCGLGVSMLCRFAAKRGSMYSNSLLSEGLAIPFFLFFFRFLYAYALDQKKKDFIMAAVFSFLLISIRKQMTVSLLLLCLVYFVCKVREKKWFQGIWQSVLILIAVFGIATFFDCTCNLFIHGSFVRHANDNRFVMTMVFFEADREDGQYIENEEVRELFYQIYDTCEAQGYFIGRDGKDWYERSTLFADHYDNIQLDTMYPAIEAYVMERDAEGIHTNLEIDEVASQMMNPLLPRVIGKIIITAFDNIMNGLMTTVAVKTRVLIPYVYVIYLLYIALLCYIYKLERMSPVFILGSLILVTILVNVTLVAMVIFSQSRYTIYNMPLFYMGGVVMLYTAVKQKRKAL